MDLRSNLSQGLGVIAVPTATATATSKHTGGKSKQKKQIQEIDYTRVLNSCLPDDIRILAWAPVPLDFDAR